MLRDRRLFLVAALLFALPLAAQLPRVHPVPDTFERLLLPVFTDPVHGAFGSEFHTTLLLTNKNAGQEAPVYGLEPVCYVSACIGWDYFNDFLAITDFGGQPDVYYDGTPGRFVYVPKTALSSIAANLRVHDVTRSALNFGTEIPIVRAREFKDDKIVLTGVPTDPRFRNTLRIYSTMPMRVAVTVGNNPPVAVQLDGATDIFDPAYGAFTGFPAGETSVNVTIQPEHLTIPPPLPIELWAFITVTNNETQAISTITPQP